MIVQWAKDNNMESVTIGEQDLMFTAPDAWDYYLKQMPTSIALNKDCIPELKSFPDNNYFSLQNLFPIFIPTIV